MAFLRSTSPADGEAEIHGQEVLLRHPVMGDYQAWAELRAMSRQHLTVWEPQWARDELTRSAFRRRLRQYQREMKEDLQSSISYAGGRGLADLRKVNYVILGGENAGEHLFM